MARTTYLPNAVGSWLNCCTNWYADLLPVSLNGDPGTKFRLTPQSISIVVLYAYGHLLFFTFHSRAIYITASHQTSRDK
jgi:hypothetical protein